MFTMSADPLFASMLHFKVEGLWDEEDAGRFGKAAAALIATVPVPAGRHVSTMDISAFKIQSQSIVRACHDMIEQGVLGHRVAYIVGDGLARIQLRRVAVPGIEVREFAHIFQARHWLLSQGDSPGRFAIKPEDVSYVI